MKITRAIFFSPVFLLLLLFISVSCGKKGDPTLKAFEQPQTPSNLRAIHREDKLYLLWDFPKAAERTIAGFILLKSSGQDRGFEKLLHLPPDKRLHIDTDFSPGAEYDYKIISQSHTAVYGSDSNIISVTFLETPSPPASVTFRAEQNALFLSWQSTGPVRYNVYRSYEKGNYGITPVNRSPLSENTFRDIFTTSKPVYYTIRSLKDTPVRNEGAPSPELTVNPFDFIPSAPKRLQSFATPDRVFLYWDEPAETWVTGFRVYRKSEGTDYILIGETQIPTFVDKENTSVKRDYRVTAVGPSREGPATELPGIVFAPGR